MASGHTVRMSARLALLFVGALTVATVAFFVFTPKSAAHPKKCDPYSKNCPGTTLSPSITTTSTARDPDDTSTREKLQVTGADLTLFVATGIAAIGTGGILVRATRSRR